MLTNRKITPKINYLQENQIKINLLSYSLGLFFLEMQDRLSHQPQRQHYIYIVLFDKYIRRLDCCCVLLYNIFGPKFVSLFSLQNSFQPRANASQLQRKFDAKMPINLTKFCFFKKS